MTIVIMAGGKGERLWPLVRTATPKICLSPNGQRPLLLSTIERLRAAWPNADWCVITTQEQATAIQACLKTRAHRYLLVEPQAKNTAACIMLAALAVGDPNRILVIAPADHWINRLPAFRSAVRSAIQAAATHQTVVAIGIRPSYAHPGLGHLRVGARLGHGRPRRFRLSSFIEKPGQGLAKRLLHQQGTLWNSGIFVGTAGVFRSVISQHLPAHARRLRPLEPSLRVWRRRGPARPPATLCRAYRQLRSVSFDAGVMTHLRKGLVVEGTFGWADVGSWDAWARISPASGELISVESHNVQVVSQEPHVVAAVGVRDLLIVRTPSATLICRSNRTQAVREVVRRLRRHPRLRAWL